MTHLMGVNEGKLKALLMQELKKIMAEKAI